MCSTRVLKSLVALLAAVVVVCSYSAATLAQSADQSQEAKMRVLQERIDALSKELKDIKEEQAKTTKTVSTVDKAWNTFIKGFFGTLDGSIDYTTKGMNDMVAYHWGSAPDGGPPYVNNGPKSPPFGRVSWMAMMSSNGSNIGYRGSHKIGSSDVDFIYQVSAAIDLEVGQVSETTGRHGTPRELEVPIHWKAAERAGLFPVMNAELAVYPLTATETQLDFQGRYEPPMGPLGSAIDAAVGHRIAEAAVHRFIVEVAQYLRATLGQ